MKFDALSSDPGTYILNFWRFLPCETSYIRTIARKC